VTPDAYFLKRIFVQIGGVIAIAAILGTFLVAYNATYASVADLDRQAGERWAKLAGDLVERYRGIPGLLSFLGQPAGPGAPDLREVSGRFGTWEQAFSAGDTVQLSRATADLEASLAPVTAYLQEHPELAAGEEAREYLAALAATASEIAADRQSYNDAAHDYNLALNTFPGTLWADNWGFAPMNSFTAQVGNQESPPVPGN
jgi:hypothetical protein